MPTAGFKSLMPDIKIPGMILCRMNDSLSDVSDFESDDKG
jgi:hypothetical protein